MTVHQFVARTTGAIESEELFGDRVVRFLYSTARESAPWLFRAVTSRRMTDWLAYWNFDSPLGARLLGNRGFLRRCGVALDECVEPLEYFDTPRRIFERQIRYWACRPMPTDRRTVVSPCDARVLIGSLDADEPLWIKGKFFQLDELLGRDEHRWLGTFDRGDVAVFRLTPDKYHHNHSPVSGRVVDHYVVHGAYNACNPAAVVEAVTPYSKNRRVVTVIDTDVPDGTGVGKVAMIEVVALMIGDVAQRYSAWRYDDPVPVEPGLFMARGQVKSLYRPGSSTTILLFERDRIAFCDDLLDNRWRPDARSRFNALAGEPLVETEVAVRSPLATSREVLA